MNNPAWTNTTGSFSVVYTSAQNGHIYAIDSFGLIHSFDASTLSWSSITGPSSNPVVSISVGTDGSYGIVENTGDTYLYSYGSWTNLYTPSLCIAVGDAQNYVITDLVGTIVESSYGSVSYYTGPTKLSATAGLGKVMGVNGAGVVYQKISSSYSSVAGKTLKQIDVSLSPSSSGAQICGVDSAGDAWTLSGSAWIQIAKPGSLTSSDKFVSVEVGIGEIWATFSNGQVFCGAF